MNRRKFIEKSGRSVFLGGLAIIGIVVTTRKGFNRESCSNDFLCKNCKKLKNCNLPEAKEIKK